MNIHLYSDKQPAAISLSKGTKRTQGVRFIIARFYGEIDRGSLGFVINTRNSNGVAETQLLKKTVTERQIFLDWIVKGAITAEAGTAEYNILGTGTDADGKLSEWRSPNGYVNILDSYDVYATDEEEEAASDILTFVAYVNTELSSVITAGQAAKEAAARANEAAARANEAATNIKEGKDGKDGVSATHSWNGTVLTITSASGSSSADLKGERGPSGATGKPGVYIGKEEPEDPTISVWINPDGEPTAGREIPTASSTVKGGVMVGEGLQMNGDVLNAEVSKKDIDKLSEEIKNKESYRIDEYPASSFKLNYWIITGGVDIVDLTPVSKQGWACIAVPCKAGDIATFSAYGGVGARAWAMVGSDGAVLNASQENAQLLDYELVIPQKCTLVINAAVKSSYTYYLKVKTKVVDNTIEILKSRFATDVLFDADGWQKGHIQTNQPVGSIVDFDTITEANYSRMILDCYAGMKFKIAGRGGDKGRLWCFVDYENVINSRAEAYAANTEVIAPIDGKIIIQAETSNKSYPKSVQCTAYTLAPVAEVVKKLMPTFAGALVFAEGASLRYEAPEIAAMPSKNGLELLTHYYDLYDALMAAHPDYISKVDCDAELAAAGIVRPDYYADYPTYMYKFIPAYTSNGSELDGVTDASRFKVYLLSGTHPEMMAIWDMYNTMRLICEEWKSDENLEALRWQCEFYILPLACPYCVANKTRPNYNGVDPNRNSPTSDWTLTASGTNTYSGPEPASEYETKLYAYYMQQIKPHVFIDHHNTEAVSDPGSFMYVTSKRKANIDVAAAHISAMSRRWKKRFPGILPDDNTTIFGFAHETADTGVRATYGHECGAYSYVFETNLCLAYDNGVPTTNAHYADAAASTIATDGFINFLLIALRNAAQRISAQVVD